MRRGEISRQEREQGREDFFRVHGAGGGDDDVAADNPLFPFPDRLTSVFSALDEKANS